jgi:GDP-D-mannose dehydratase
LISTPEKPSQKASRYTSDVVNTFETFRQNQSDKQRLLDLIKSETFGKADDWRLIETTPKSNPNPFISPRAKINHWTLEKIKAGLSSD